MARWFETFFDELYSRILANQFSESESRAQAGIARRLLRLREGQRVLDIPCGMGRLTIPLARMGLAMTGVDLSPRYIGRARRRARAEGVSVRFIRADMRRIDFDGEFDAVLNWFTSFGYFSDAENLAALRRLCRALKPGGRLLIDGMNKLWLAAHFRGRSEETVGGVHVAQRHRWDRRTSRVRSTWTLRRGRVIRRRSFAIRVYSSAEIRELLRAAGLGDIRLYGVTLRGRPMAGRFTRHSRRMVAVASRPAE